MEKFLRLAEKLGADSAEIFYQHSSTTTFSTIKNSIYSKESNIRSGYGIRVLKNGRIGFSHFSNKDAERGIKTAIKLSAFSEKTKFALPSKQTYKNVLTYDKRVGRLSKEKAKELIEELLAKICENANPTECMLIQDIEMKKIMNSNGVYAEEKCSQITIYAHAAHNNSIGDDIYSSIFLDVDIGKIGERVGLLAKKMSKAKEMKTQKTEVIFDERVLHSLFHRLFAPTINGDRARRKISFFWDKIGEKVADERISIWDDPFAMGVGARKFDGEGITSDKKELIKNGYLCNFLYDLKTLSLLKNSAKPGNAFRHDYLTPPSISPSNIVIDSGETKNVISECREGLYVYSIFGVHTANELTGDFSVPISIGFRVERGELTTPVKNLILSDNFFKLLNKIEHIEKKQNKFFELITPKISFKDVFVVGK